MVGIQQIFNHWCNYIFVEIKVCNIDVRNDY